MDEITKNISSVIKEILLYSHKEREEIETILQKTLTNSEQMFDLVSNYQHEFVKDETRPVEFYYKALDQLTGIYMYLSPIVSVSESLISKQSLKKYNLLKTESLNNKEKFTSASAERDSENHVSEMNILFSVFEGYLDSCKQGIQTCRSRLKVIEEEFGLNK